MLFNLWEKDFQPYPQLPVLVLIGVTRRRK